MREITIIKLKRLTAKKSGNAICRLQSPREMADGAMQLGHSVELNKSEKTFSSVFKILYILHIFSSII